MCVKSGLALMCRASMSLSIIYNSMAEGHAAFARLD